MLTVGRTGVKLIVACRSFANVPKKRGEAPSKISSCLREPFFNFLFVTNAVVSEVQFLAFVFVLFCFCIVSFSELVL